jgi:hypothetical protein
MDLSSYVNLALITIDIGLPHIRDVCRNSHPMQCSHLFQQAVKLSAFSKITDLTFLSSASTFRILPYNSRICSWIAL